MKNRRGIGKFFEIKKYSLLLILLIIPLIFLFYNLLAVSVSSAVLNSTHYNTTAGNLTAYPVGAADYTTIIYDWRLEDISIAVLNMPFDTNDVTGARDYTSYAHNATCGDNTTCPNWTSSGISGGALNVSSDGEAMEIPYSDEFNFADQITIVAWVKQSATDSESQSIVRRGCCDAYGAPWVDFVLETNATGFPQFVPQTASGPFITADGNLTLDTWTFLAATYNGTLFSLYVNGVLNNSKTGSGIIPNTGSRPIVIGTNDVSYPGSFHGLIDGILIYNRSLSAEQILAMYNSGAPKYDLMVTEELSLGDNWSVAVTPNNVTQDGTTISSNYLSVINDTGFPSVSILYPDNTTYSSTLTQLNYSASDDNALVGCWYSTDGGETNSSSNDCSSNFTGLSSSIGSNNWTVYVNDSGGHITSSTIFFTQNTTSTSTTTGGTETSTTSNTTTSETTSTPVASCETPIRNIASGESDLFTNFCEVTEIKEISLSVNDSVQSVKINVEKYDGKPAGVSSKSGKVYKYLKIDVQNVLGKLKNAVIKFRVEKTWVETNGLGEKDLALFRYSEKNSAWEELDTSYEDSDTSHYNYRAKTESFSYFAIAEGTNDTAIGEFFDFVSEKKGLFLIGFLVIMLSVLAVIIIIAIKKEKAQMSSSTQIQSNWNGQQYAQSGTATPSNTNNTGKLW